MISVLNLTRDFISNKNVQFRQNLRRVFIKSLFSNANLNRKFCEKI